MAKSINILFVCLGNICRSPTAEAVFNQLLKKRGLSTKYKSDSAGTSGHHQGELADPRMRKHSSARGIELLSRSRPFTAADFEKFDYIMAMDDRNLRDILKYDKSGEYAQKVKRMMSYCYKYSDLEVPDPYFGGDAGFEHVLDILEDACANFLDLLEENKIT